MSIFSPLLSVDLKHFDVAEIEEPNAEDDALGAAAAEVLNTVVGACRGADQFNGSLVLFDTILDHRRRYV